MRDHTGCAGVMVGRGTFGNPWLFRDAQALLRGEAPPPAPDASERIAVALQHCRLAAELQGDTRKTIIEFRKHFGWYMRGIPGAAALREQLFQVETLRAAEDIFAAYLARDPVAAAA
jgi:tRNA-dihydrouridine synthase